MTSADIIRNRLINQQLVNAQDTTPQELISRLVALQSQEFAMAKWAISLRLPAGKARLPGVKDTAIEKEFNEGRILRTHVMRPTWHFVTPEDIRWLLALTAPRVHALNAYYYRQQELDDAIFRRSNKVLAKTLQGGKQLTRDELKTALEHAKITASGVRLVCLLMYAELSGLICSGARRGKQFTYALLEERAPGNNKTFHREEALATLAHRYFASRSPATLQDFVWWSGLTMKDAQAGAAMLPASFIREVVNGQEYILNPVEYKGDPARSSRATFLLPDFDEYSISYKDRSALFNDRQITLENRDSRLLVVNGVVAGAWKRTIKNKTVCVETFPFKPLSRVKQQAVNNAVKRYCLFFDLKPGKEKK